MPCKRSETVTIPQILMTFKASDPDSGLSVKYRIERLFEDRFSEVIDLMAKVFIKDEVTCASLELINDPDFDGRKSWIEVLNKRISLVCFKEGSDEICGFNLLEVLQKDSEKPEIEVKSKNLEDIVKVKSFIHAKADTYNRHGVDKFLHSRGLLIVPKYRGLGLSTKILKARIPLGRALGVKVSGTIFTSDVSQKAAAKAGFAEDFSVLYEDLRNKDPFVDFPNVSFHEIHEPHIRLKNKYFNNQIK